MQLPDPPSNHPPLAPMVEADLDLDTFDRLIEDLSVCATITGITLKETARSPTPLQLSVNDLQLARTKLLDRQACSVQLRYTFAGQHWIDTIRLKDDQLKLVRVQCPTAQPES